MLVKMPTVSSCFAVNFMAVFFFMAVIVFGNSSWPTQLQFWVWAQFVVFCLFLLCFVFYANTPLFIMIPQDLTLDTLCWRMSQNISETGNSVKYLI